MRFTVPAILDPVFRTPEICRRKLLLMCCVTERVLHTFQYIKQVFDLVNYAGTYKSTMPILFKQLGSNSVDDFKLLQHLLPGSGVLHFLTCLSKFVHACQLFCDCDVVGYHASHAHFHLSANIVVLGACLK